MKFNLIVSVLMSLMLTDAFAGTRVNYESEEAEPAHSIDMSMDPVIEGRTSYNISIFSVNTFGGNNMCDIEGSFQMSTVGGKPTFTHSAAEGSCVVTITFDNNKYLKGEIDQKGSDVECGCGLNASVAGRIKVKKRNK